MANLQTSSLEQTVKMCRLQLIGLGDVGGALLTGLVLLGAGLIQSIGIFDPDDRRVARYVQEMNQILPPGLPQYTPAVFALSQGELFEECDAMIFAASAGVPPIHSGIADVRMAQYKKNRNILSPYARLAAQKGFSGLFFQVSDPVDRLCLVIADSGFAPDRIIGCGLGVMLARANYFARKRGLMDFFEKGRVYGPHGNGLIVANATDDTYNDALSRALTEETVSANLLVRQTGYKPYIAPGLSSGSITILRALRHEWFDGSIQFQEVFFGCRARLTESGMEQEPLPDQPLLRTRIDKTLDNLTRERFA